MAIGIGETKQVQGSGSKPWTIKNVDDKIKTCNCPAWCNQGKGKGVLRTCKHLKAEFGAAAEEARIAGTAAPVAVASPAPVAGLAAVATAPAPSAPQNPHARRWDATPAERAAIVSHYEATVGHKIRQDELTKLFGPPVLLANDYEDVDDLDPTGWWMSEKLDGVRAYWDGDKFVSRPGNTFFAPDWFRKDLPDHPLDGELWMGRKLFQKTVGVVKTPNHPDWNKVKYMVFDAPHLKISFEERLAFLRLMALERKFSVGPEHHVNIHYHSYCGNMAALMAELDRIVALGAEGLMLRKPGSLYVANRSSTLLKVKPFKTAEAVIIGTEKSTTGQFKGLIGALWVQMPNGNKFKLNAKTMDLRRNPPANGTTVTYWYTELTDDGIPKCASFLRIWTQE